MAEVRQTVIELLGQLGSSREARQYLKQFSRIEESRFAVVKVGGAVLRDDLDELAAALAFLHRLGLTPIVLHGAGPQLDQAMHEAGVPVEKHNGLRVTTEEVMAVARPVIYKANARLVDALEARGVRARGILHGVFNARLADRENAGPGRGEIESVDLASLRSAVKAGALPVVACLGESGGRPGDEYQCRYRRARTGLGGQTVQGHLSDRDRRAIGPERPNHFGDQYQRRL